MQPTTLLSSQYSSSSVLWMEIYLPLKYHQDVIEILEGVRNISPSQVTRLQPSERKIWLNSSMAEPGAADKCAQTASQLVEAKKETKSEQGGLRAAHPTPRHAGGVGLPLLWSAFPLLSFFLINIYTCIQNFNLCSWFSESFLILFDPTNIQTKVNGI